MKKAINNQKNYLSKIFMLINVIKEYSIYGSILIIVSFISYVAYEKDAYETKISLLEEKNKTLISLKDEKISILEERIKTLEKKLDEENILNKRYRDIEEKEHKFAITIMQFEINKLKQK
jgi:hypothetical protein